MFRGVSVFGISFIMIYVEGIGHLHLLVCGFEDILSFVALHTYMYKITWLFYCVAESNWSVLCSHTSSIKFVASSFIW